MQPETLDRILGRHGRRASKLIEILLDVQEEAGYLPADALKAIADELRVPEIEVYRIARFYKAFSLAPRGRHVITVCQGTACHVRGSPRMLEEVRARLGIRPGQTTKDSMFSLESVNCLGACALGPVVVVDGEYHDHMTRGKLRRLIDLVRDADKTVATHA